MNTFYIYILYKLWCDSDTSAEVVWTYGHSFVFLAAVVSIQPHIKLKKKKFNS